MRLTDISKSRTRRDILTLTLSDGETIDCTESVIARLSLYAGAEIPEARLPELRAAAAESSARVRAAVLIGSRPLSEKALVEKLVEKGESPEGAALAAGWLRDMGAIDDAKYAQTVARHYRNRGYGARRILSELYRRGVDRETAAEAAAEPNEGGAYSYLSSRYDPADAKSRKRVSDALCRRGFSWDDISAAFKQYEEEHTEE